MITQELIEEAGAELPTLMALEAAVIGCIQFQDIHERKELFKATIFWLNRGLTIARYLCTDKQFDEVLESLIARGILVRKEGGYYHHPEIQKIINQNLELTQNGKRRKRRKSGVVV